MDCAPIREALSARLDDEEPGLAGTAVDAHLEGCAACRHWVVDAATLHRRTRVRPADPVPDLSTAILEAAPRHAPARPAVPWGQPISATRWALLVLALTQLVLAGTVLVGGETVHLSRELAAFDVALAAGLLVAAWQPARAWGLLPAAIVLVVVLTGTAITDIASGAATPLGETVHLLDLAGVLLLWLVARESPAPARLLSRARPA